jgi:drug/metabolite transporter (DMT)-like permease
MSLRDFGLLILICLVWAMNTVLSKVVITQMGVPPMSYALVRFILVAVLVLPWLLPMPRPRWRLLIVALLMGGGNFVLLFIGLKTASPSGAAIVSQLGVPMTTLLSMFMLGETIRWRRGIGISLTFAGAMTVVWDPHGAALSSGLMLIAAAAFLGSLGAVMMKQMEGVKPLQFQAWVGASSILPLMLLSALFEHDQLASMSAAGLPFMGALVFSALVVSVLGHTAYYGLIQKYEANLIAPLTLMTPLFTIGLGVVLTHDHFDLRMGIGTAIALAGVLIIALRPNHALSVAELFRSRQS